MLSSALAIWFFFIANINSIHLVDTCKVCLSHEKEVFNQLAELRAQAATGKMDISAIENLDKAVSKSVGNLLLMAENYPELILSNNFIKLRASGNETEDQIAASRRFYNSALADYNNSVQMFPSNIVASIIGMKTKEVFKASETEKANVSAKDLFCK